MEHQRTVMIVEDEPVIRGLLSITLEAESYEVQTASNGLEALEKVRDKPPDAILLDLLLPVMDGWTLIDKLDADSEFGDIPVVAVSASDRYVDVGEHNVYAFLSKPFDVDTLLTVLDDVIAEHETRALLGEQAG